MLETTGDFGCVQFEAKPDAQPKAACTCAMWDDGTRRLTQGCPSHDYPDGLHYGMQEIWGTFSDAQHSKMMLCWHNNQQAQLVTVTDDDGVPE